MGWVFVTHTYGSYQLHSSFPNCREHLVYLAPMVSPVQQPSRETLVMWDTRDHKVHLDLL